MNFTEKIYDTIDEQMEEGYPMVTLNDIAKIANVSKSTVSRYLNNGSVSEKTKNKLDKIIKDTGYQPNRLAQSLKASKSNMIGVIIPRYNSPSTNLVMEGIDTVAYREGIQLMIMNSNLNLNRTKNNIKSLERQKVEAIVLFATLIDEDLSEQIKHSNIPIILVGQELREVSFLTYQDYEAGRSIAQHAIDLGHRKILFVGVTEEDHAVGVLRKKGFYDVAKKAGAEIKFVETEFSRTYSYKKALKFLPEMDATYIAAATDHIAVGIFNAGMELGFSIPNDFSLSGFGGYSVTQNVFPNITTVSYPFEDLGKLVIQEVQKIIQSEIENREIRVKLPVELTIQGSTKKI